MTRQQPAAATDLSPATWHTAIYIHGQPYPTRHYAPNAQGSDDDSFELEAPQLNHMRAIHEAGHAIAALIGRAHLHFAQITLGAATSARSGVTDCCNFTDGQAFAVFCAAGERAVDRWLRENGLWTPKRAVAAEVGAYGDRRLCLSVNPHVGYGDRDVDYDYIHDLADQDLDQHWAAVVRVADQLVQEQRLDADTIIQLAGLPNGRGSAKCPERPLTEPRKET
jgi:hypothetical protein